MSDRSAAPSAFPPDHVRVLPERPNLEFERKQAKLLLRQLRAGDSTAHARVHRAMREAPGANACQLSDAQLAIAREYGFTSWPRLVEYFASAERHERSQPARATYRLQHYRDAVTQLLRLHRSQHWSVAPRLATWVPRMFAKSDAEIFATTLHESEAELAVARGHHFASWSALMIAAEKDNSTDEGFRESPFGRAQQAVGVGDLDELQAIVAAHPELLGPATSGPATGISMLQSALGNELRVRSEIARTITDWLATQSGDLQHHLNTALLGGMRVSRSDIEYLLSRGADPNWIPANGATVLEHLLLRSWSPGPAEAVAAVTTPRDACWIAVGLGNTAAMTRFIARDGTLADAVRNDRPDFALTAHILPVRPGAHDRDLLFELLTVAAFNHRRNCIDFLLERGLAIDYSPYRFNVLHWAVGNRIVPVVEHLLLRGADRDLKGWMPEQSAREMAAGNLEHMPNDAGAQKIMELMNS